ncbi:MAG: hypothetical protein AB7S39_06290 [Gemmatimonadales bacterium]
MTIVRRLAALPLLGLGLVSPGHAQAVGVPIRNAGVSQGISVSGEVGFGRIKRPNDDDTSTGFGAFGTVGLGPIGAALGVTRVNIDPAGSARRESTTLNAAANLTVFGGPLVPLRITWQVGAARGLDGPAKDDWRGHLGLGAALTIPAVAFALRSWIAPRVEYLGREPAVGDRIRGAVSAGIDLGLLNGMGLRVSYDSRLGWDSNDDRATGIGIGASFQF